jgi:hypothetical protein
MLGAGNVRTARGGRIASQPPTKDLPENNP